MIWQKYKYLSGAGRPVAALCLSVWILLAGGQCLALDESCGSDDTNCQLEPALTAFLTIEFLSFRPPACGTYNPAAYVDESEGLLSALLFAGPISLTPSLAYDSGFVNRPMHLIGCRPSLVSSSVSVNAGPPAAISETYTYNALGLVTGKVLITPGTAFGVDITYAPNDYPALIRGDCQAGINESSTIRLDYDLLSRLQTSAQYRPLNCDGTSPNQRVANNTSAYASPERSPNFLNVAVAEFTGTVTVSTTNLGTPVYTRDSAGRLTRRDQTEDITIVVSSPASTNSFTRNFAFNYSYDSEGRMTQFTGSRGPTTNATINYTYDSAGRVVGMNSTGMAAGMAANSTDTFTYDASGNIVTHVSNFTVGANNTITNFTFTY